MTWFFNFKKLESYASTLIFFSFLYTYIFFFCLNLLVDLQWWATWIPYMDMLFYGCPVIRDFSRPDIILLHNVDAFYYAPLYFFSLFFSSSRDPAVSWIYLCTFFLFYIQIYILFLNFLVRFLLKGIFVIKKFKDGRNDSEILDTDKTTRTNFSWIWNSWSRLRCFTVSSRQVYFLKLLEKWIYRLIDKKNLFYYFFFFRKNWSGFKTWQSTGFFLWKQVKNISLIFILCFLILFN